MPFNKTVIDMIGETADYLSKILNANSDQVTKAVKGLTERLTCRRCRGVGHLPATKENIPGVHRLEATDWCPACNGKGH